MFDSRRLAFVMSAMLVAGAGLYGCEEEQDWGPIKDDIIGDGGGDNSGDNTHVEPTEAPAVCKDASKCMDSPECSTKVGIAACMCVTIPERCRYDASCKGIGSCKYECRENYEDENGNIVNTCAWSVCAGEGDCAAACNPATLPAGQDYDGDGILNEIERDNGKSDPCKHDTDDDGVPDGKEDLNHDGIIQFEFGETDPSSAASRPTPGAETDVKESACDAQKMRGENVELTDLRVAKLKDATYSDAGTFTVFNHQAGDANDVVGFFGAAQPITGSRLLKNALGEGNYIEESNFKSTVPLASWSKGGIYQQNLQIVPNHTVDRYKLTINMSENDTLEGLSSTIARELFGKEAPKLSGSTKCEVGGDADKNKAILYLARSSYTDANTNETIYLYSGALGCRNSVSDPASVATANVMEDTLSGTLVAPNRIGNTNGYMAFEQFVCQAEKFGESQGAVDFIWVIDNSGSMKDEINNLIQTVDAFTARLNGSGIDYRLAVTTTDAYLLDEQAESNGSTYGYDDLSSSVTYLPYDSNSDYCANMTAYFNGLGIHTIAPALPCMLGSDNLNNFKENVSKFSGMPNRCDGNMNICGKGFEDGLKSVALTLERLYLNVSDTTAPEGYDQAWWDEFVKIKRNVAYMNRCAPYNQSSSCTTPEDQAKESCKAFMDRCMLRTDALKYIIFVSDEDSRQFKENSEVSSHKSHLNGCLTGYELTSTENIYHMVTGMYTGEQKCNPSLQNYINDLNARLEETNSSSSLEDMSLEEIKASGDGKYYDMITYYMEQMRKYAGSQSIVAFSLVGDAGLENGGKCKVLATCAKDKCEDWDDVNKDGNYDTTECNDCLEWNYNDAAATLGANHGLSYIHIARFLSTVYTDANGQTRTDGKEGGYGSICNTDYNITVNSIFEDVVGRVAAHPLKGYPIASTIVVSAIVNGKAVELTRGNTEMGWRYDASQNAIIFSFADDDKRPGKDDYIAISYVIWKKVQG